MPVKKRRSTSIAEEGFDNSGTEPAGRLFDQTFAGTSARAVSIGRVIDRLCRAPGTYQISICVPVQRRAPWQITYYRMEPMRKEGGGGK